MSTPLEQLNGLIQRIYSDDARYVLISKVQFGTMWTIEIGSVGEAKPRWWRSVLDAEDIPKGLVRISSCCSLCRSSSRTLILWLVDARKYRSGHCRWRTAFVRYERCRRQPESKYSRHPDLRPTVPRPRTLIFHAIPSIKLKFYPSRPEAGSLHLMSYSAEESAQRAEKILFEVGRSSSLIMNW